MAHWTRTAGFRGAWAERGPTALMGAQPNNLSNGNRFIIEAYPSRAYTIGAGGLVDVTAATLPGIPMQVYDCAGDRWLYLDAEAPYAITDTVHGVLGEIGPVYTWSAAYGPDGTIYATDGTKVYRVDPPV